MIYDLQKASLLKRASAWLLDVILLAVLACGFGMVLSSVTNYDLYIDALEAGYEKYETEYNIDFGRVSILKKTIVVLFGYKGFKFLHKLVSQIHEK